LLQKSEDSKSVFLDQLPKFLRVSPETTFEYCISQFPELQPREIKAHVDFQADYVEYVSALVASDHPWPSSDTICDFFRDLLFADLPFKRLLFDDGGLPKRGSHEVVWTFQKPLMRVLTISQQFPSVATNLLALTKQYGFFQGELFLLLSRQHLVEALDLILATDDFPSFSRLMKDNPHACNNKFWENAIHKYCAANLRQPSTSISPALFLETMSTCLGPLEAVNLLMPFTKKTGGFPKLPIGAFRTVLAEGKSQIQRRSMVHKTLADMDAYLWTGRPSVLSPQFLALENAESNQQVIPQNLLVLLVSSTPRFLEDCHVHWGVQTDFDSVCPRSGIWLSMPTSKPNLVVFPSGYAYHQASLGEGACIKTMESRFGSLLD